MNFTKQYPINMLAERGKKMGHAAVTSKWWSLFNTMPVYGLVKSTDTVYSINTVWSMASLFMTWWYQVIQFGQYHACLWSGEVNILYWHSLVDTMPVYGLVKSTDTVYSISTVWSILSLFKTWWHQVVWSIPCLFIARCSQLTRFGQYHSLCLFIAWWSQYWQNSVDTMPVYGLAM